MARPEPVNATDDKGDGFRDLWRALAKNFTTTLERSCV
jgi:hypothetical protein